jgi:hypothetical protein
VIWKTKNPHHIQVFHNLQEEDYPRRAATAALCAELIEQIDSANLINNILFSDEATFHTRGKVSRNNCHIWADEKPPDSLEWERDKPKVNVWIGMTQSICTDISSLQRLQKHDPCILTCLKNSLNINSLQMPFLTQKFFDSTEHRAIMQ